jgi:glucose uptake protein
MVIIESYPTAVILCLITMICWGSWANTMKLTGKKWFFQLYYWDYSIGVLLFSLVLAFTLGSHGRGGRPFLSDLFQSESKNLFYAFLSGTIFNLSNVLLVTVIDIAGMAIAFPIGVGLALVLGVISGYLSKPLGNPWILFSGLACIVLAIILDGLAYSKIPSDKNKSVTKGIVLSICTGVFMGFFYPLLVSSISPTLYLPQQGKLTPYTAIVIFSAGLFASSFLWNYYLMRKPLSGPIISGRHYFTQGTRKDHLVSILGGLIWCLGFSLMTLSAEKAGTAISYGLGQGATMVAVVWGVLVWKEFKLAPKSVDKLLVAMFFLYLSGLSLIIIAKQY